MWGEQGLTCTGLARGLAAWSTMDSATLPPNECPTSTRGTSLKCRMSCSTSRAAEATVCGAMWRAARLPLPPPLPLPLLEPELALSPWHRRSTSSICQAGKSLAKRRANETQFFLLPRMPCRNTAVGGAA